MTQRFDIIEATFQPQNRETLKPEMVPFIGYRGRWEAAWIVDEEDDSQFTGQWAWTPHPVLGTPIPYGWVPDEDLVDRLPAERTPRATSLGGHAPLG